MAEDDVAAAMEVEQEAPRSCGACGFTVTDTRIIQARWFAYTDPSGWIEWGQICGPCLNTQWRSMNRSWDPDIHDATDCSHSKWKEGLFMKVIRKRLRDPELIDEVVRDPSQYELKWPVVSADEPLDAYRSSQ